MLEKDKSLFSLLVKVHREWLGLGWEGELQALGSQGTVREPEPSLCPPTRPQM